MDCGSFFDRIDDLLQFPNDDNDFHQYNNAFIGNKGEEAYNNFNFIDVQQPPAAAPAGDDIRTSVRVSSSPITTTTTTPTGSDLLLPYEDVVQLEWLSAFVEDSFSGGCTMMSIHETHCTPSPFIPNRTRLRSATTSSPVSVLDSSSTCCSTGNKAVVPLTSHHEKRARTKRPRPVTSVIPHPAPMNLIISPPSSSTAENDNSLSPLLANSDDSDNNFAESRPLNKPLPKPAVRNSKTGTTTKTKFLLPSMLNIPNAAPVVTSVRKCLHCDITKTPQWRAGPMGPKTLCNACGVRYKSGRLFPEYRPAASPAFVPSKHSNSHRKVLEMRSRTTTTFTTPVSEIQENL